MHILQELLLHVGLGLAIWQAGACRILFAVQRMRLVPPVPNLVWQNCMGKAGGQPRTAPSSATIARDGTHLVGAEDHEASTPRARLLRKVLHILNDPAVQRLGILGRSSCNRRRVFRVSYGGGSQPTMTLLDTHVGPITYLGVWGLRSR